MATAELLDEKQTSRDPQHFLLRGLDWEVYRKLRDALEECHVRLTYDDGRKQPHPGISRLGEGPD
jgi:hypothetical protein